MKIILQHSSLIIALINLKINFRENQLGKGE
jgi:hypothetical protein